MPEIKEKWEEIKEYIKVEFDINPVSYDTWIAPLQLFDVVDNLVKITIPSENSHALNYITNKYKSFFTVAISEMFNSTYEVVFILDKANEDFEEEKNLINSVASNINYINANLNSKYKFTSFITGNNNKLAKSAALAVAESPGEVYNPLYIYGGPGLGKTHLMQAIGHFILETKPETKVIYTASETFTNDVIESIRDGNQAEISKMRDKYRNADVLMIDDIQFLIGKNSTQEVFFNTFNALHMAGKQIVLSSDRHPKELETFDERFKSRFGMGLIVDIQKPDFETRVAILRQLADNNSKKIDDDIINYIAENVNSNIRELEGAFNQIINLTKTLNSEYINLESAENALKNIINNNQNNIITTSSILEEICKDYNVSPDDIKSTRRNQELVTPRHVFMYLCRIMLDMTYEDIARSLNRKDHTTILHGYKKVSKEINDNPEFDLRIKSIINKINPPNI